MAGTAPLILTQRDVLLIEMVYDYRGTTIKTLHRKFFPSNTKGSTRACYRRIAALVRAGYLCSRRLPAETGVGSGKAFLTVGPASRPILAETLGLSPSELARTRLAAPAVI